MITECKYIYVVYAYVDDYYQEQCDKVVITIRDDLDKCLRSAFKELEYKSLTGGFVVRYDLNAEDVVDSMVDLGTIKASYIFEPYEHEEVTDEQSK